MININYGHNKELMDRRRRLKELRGVCKPDMNNEKRGMALDEAVKQAVHSCIEEGSWRTF